MESTPWNPVGGSATAISSAIEPQNVPEMNIHREVCKEIMSHLGRIVFIFIIILTSHWKIKYFVNLTKLTSNFTIKISKRLVMIPQNQNKN